jgi:hypothetical protein
MEVGCQLCVLTILHHGKPLTHSSAELQFLISTLSQVTTPTVLWQVLCECSIANFIKFVLSELNFSNDVIIAILKVK